MLVLTPTLCGTIQVTKKKEITMNGQQHVHAEGQIPTITINVIGRSSRGNLRDLELLTKEIEQTIEKFSDGRFMHDGVGGWIDYECKDCC